MVTKKHEIRKDELLRLFDALPEGATVEAFIDHLAEVIGLERSPWDSKNEPTIVHSSDRMKKRQLMESLGRLPKDATVDDVAYRLYVISKVERGMAESAAGNKVSHEEARERLKHWLE